MQLSKTQDRKYATRETTPTNEDNMLYYSEDFPEDYTIVTNGENVISLPDIPVGAKIVRVDLETKPVALANYNWNPTSRVLTLVAGPTQSEGDSSNYPTFAGQLLSVIYKIIKTTV